LSLVVARITPAEEPEQTVAVELDTIGSGLTVITIVLIKLLNMILSLLFMK
jgi:hypothetical protein